VERRQRPALLRDDEDTRGVPIQPVDELQEARVRTLPPKLLDYTGADAAPAVNRHACGFVDNEQGLVLVQDMASEPRAAWPHGCERGGALCRPHWWKPKLVAGLQSMIRPHPAAIYAHFAAAQDAVNVAFRYAFEEPRQIIVDALRGAFFAHFMPGCGIFT